jgi:hypothetical protein
MSEHIRTIEIEGHKFEVDMRSAKKIEAYRVGDRVKVLKKNYSSYEVHPGAIVGIDCFKALPTIVVAYVPGRFSDDGKVEFAYMNAESKDVEIAPMSEDDLIPTRDTILTYFERSLQIHRTKIREIEIKRDYFLRQFGIAFSVGAEEVAAATSRLVAWAEGRTMQRNRHHHPH